MRPADVLRRLGTTGRVVRRLRSSHNTHWFVETPHGRVVLRRYGKHRTRDGIDYELRVVAHLDSLGWSVPVALAEPIVADDEIWCVFRFVRGRKPDPRARDEERTRGRLMARLHADLAPLAALGQRDGWLLCDQGLADRRGKPSLDDVLRAHERLQPEEARIFRECLDRTRERLAALVPLAPPPIPIHGDIYGGNVRYLRAKPCGVIDFDLAHLDLRVADFALSWRGKYGGVIEAYEDLSPLEPVERALVVPVYRMWILVSGIWAIEDRSRWGIDWALSHLARVSSLRDEA